MFYLLQYGSKDKWGYYNDPDGTSKAYVLTYSHIGFLGAFGFALFQMAWGLKWYWAAKDATGNWVVGSQLTPEQVEQQGVRQIVDLNWFRRWAGLIPLAIVVILVLVVGAYVAATA